MGPLFAGGGAGDRDYKQVVKDAFDSIDEVVSLKIDTKDKGHQHNLPPRSYKMSAAFLL